jgi:hypothetical protein
LKELARELDVSEALVSRWAGLTEMLDIDGIGIRDANLLDAAGVSNLSALRRQDPHELRGRLKETIVAGKLGRDPPAEPTIADWVAQAKSRDSQ